MIEGNYIGTTPDGEGFFGSGQQGIDVTGTCGSAMTIGGTLPGARNVISGFSQDGILIGSATGVVVQGNLIGPNASQSAVYSGTPAWSSTQAPTTTRSAPSAPVRT